MSAPASRLAGLSREQRALLFEQVRRRKEGAGAPPERIPRRPPDLDPVPASFAQERLWFMDRLAPGNAAFNIPMALRIRGQGAPASLEAVLGEVVRRHEALRTTFREVGGQAVQVIAPPGPWTLPRIDLSGLPGDARGAEARRLAQREAERPFDLQAGPLLRSALLRLDEAEHVLLLGMHHIVSDGWSMGVLIREITTIYAAAVSGAPPLPELPIQYADFAVWQRGWLRGEELERQLGYWRQRLAGAPAALDLPADRPRPAAQSYRGARLPATFGSGFNAALGAFARRHEASLYMVLLAGFQALLGRLTGQTGLTVGSPIANRHRAEVEPLIGFFVNSLVMRGDLSGDPPFRELLARVRRSTLEAYAHQDLPFERLVEELRPERHLSVTPLFQVVFALQNAPAGGADLPGLSLSPVDLEVATVQFDLELHVWERDGSLRAMIAYSTELFDPATVRRLFERLETLLRGAMADPDLPLSRLPLVPEGERHQILREWNDTAIAALEDVGIAERVAAQAAREPGAPAVVMAGHTLTYGDLLARASGLAGELRRLGVGPGSPPVGLLAARSPELVTGALAVLLAGGAYLPLDPSYPEDRLAFIARESGMPALLFQGGEAPAWAGGLQALSLASSAVPAVPVVPVVPFSALAYVIYTSGSTGRPKGVQVPHGGLLNLVRWHLRTYGVTPEDRATLIASPAFDASVWEIWPCLAAGASLHVPDEETRLDPRRLLDWLAAEGITLCFLPTPLAERLLEIAEEGSPPGLRLRALLTGGDRLQRPPRVPLPFALVNHYGPTESSVVATAAIVAPAPAESVPRPPAIGRPVDETRAYVLGPGLEPLPLEVPGELALGGAGLARGYLGRPELTAERFVPDPFSEVPGGRLYRTGDLVRFLPDDNLDFLGRIDTQVKLRGFRIELGEIESALLRHPAVREAVVELREGGEGGPRLAAWVAARPASELPAGSAEAAEHVSQWQALYDETYQRGETPEAGFDADFDIGGWNSSYTGRPIPAEEMREWVDRTVERILSLRPKRVIEIGCGTGLLLFRVAPRAESYLGADFSRVALEGIRRRLERPGCGLPQVGLRQAEADDWSGIPPGEADLVILNSVSQYFPDAGYLARVLEGAVRSLAPGGAVFVGDVRSRPLLEAFAASVELFQAPDSRPTVELARRVRARVADEEELVVDPAFFHALARRLPAVSRAAVLLKRGRWHNELTRFRYDAVLHVGEEAAAALPPAVEAEDWSLEKVERLLAGRPEALGLVGLPNARLATEETALDFLTGEHFVGAGLVPARVGAGRTAERAGTSPAPTFHHPENVADLRRPIAERARPGIDPEDLWLLGDRLGYDLALTIDLQAPFRFGAVLRRRGSAAAAGPLALPAPEVPDLPWNAFANDPLAGKLARRLAPELRRFLQGELPDYMVPASFVFLDRLPVTVHGKVDRAALPEPEPPRHGPGAGTPPRTPAEETLAALWKEVLGVPEVSLEDNFFELGGHSLLATQLVSRIRAAFGIDLPLRRLFERPVLGDLAAAVSAGEAAAPAAIPRAGRRSEVPLSFAQERYWVLGRADPAYSIPAALRLRGPVDSGILERCFQEILRRHDVLRARFLEKGDGPVQVIDPPAPWALPRIDVEALPASRRREESGRLAAEEAATPFDLARGPAFRAFLIRLAPEEHVLLVTCHHVVADGWTMGVLMGEMTVLYQAFAAGEPSPLPEPPLQYADFAVWQRERLDAAGLLDFWKQRLERAPHILEIPTDRPRPATVSLRGEEIVQLLPTGLVERLGGLGREEGASLYMVLLAALAVVLRRWSGRDDLLIGSQLAGRDRRETEGMIGVFVNLAPMRIDLTGAPSFRELLRRVRETALEAFAHQEIPFESLLRELRVRREPSRHPLVQLTFNMLNFPTLGGHLPGGVAVEPLPAARTWSRYDLTLYAAETPDGLSLRLVYSADLFDHPRMEELLRRLRAVLERAVEDPSGRPAGISDMT